MNPVIDRRRYEHQRFRMAREAKGHTEEQLAELCQADPVEVRAIERGLASPLDDLAQAWAAETGVLWHFFMHRWDEEYAFGEPICQKGIRDADRCGECPRLSVALCDHPVAPGVTCDRRLCERHRVNFDIDADLDYCPGHAKTHGLKSLALPGALA